MPARAGGPSPPRGRGTGATGSGGGSGTTGSAATGAGAAGTGGGSWTAGAGSGGGSSAAGGSTGSGAGGAGGAGGGVVLGRARVEDGVDPRDGVQLLALLDGLRGRLGDRRRLGESLGGGRQDGLGLGLGGRGLGGDGLGVGAASTASRPRAPARLASATGSGAGSTAGAGSTGGATSAARLILGGERRERRREQALGLGRIEVLAGRKRGCEGERLVEGRRLAGVGLGLPAERDLLLPERRLRLGGLVGALGLGLAFGLRPISFFQNGTLSSEGSSASAWAGSAVTSASGFDLRPISFFQNEVFSAAGSCASACVGSGSRSPSGLGLRPNEMSFFQSTIG